MDFTPKMLEWQPMVSVKRARRLLGKEAKKYSDEQLAEIIRTFTVLAEIAIDNAIEKKKVSKIK